MTKKIRLNSLRHLMGLNDPFGESAENDDKLPPGVVAIYHAKTGRVVDIWELTDQEKDTLRHIAGEITHYRIFKR